MFNICDIGPSCLLRTDVTSFKSDERAKVLTKIHNDEIPKFSSKGNMYKGIHILIIYVTSSSTVDDSTVLACCMRFGFARLK